MIYFVILCLFIGLATYLLLGGADYGAGVLELFTARKDRKYHQHITYKAIGPVWEANHVWLILVLVIVFVGFPVLNTQVMTYLHLPLTIMLVGIILRGTAFVFKHYDAVQDGAQAIYDRVYAWSSILVPLAMGLVAGAILGDKIDPEAADFAGTYLAPWLNPFAFSVGVFTVAICTFLAAAYLIGEGAPGDETHITRFTRKAKWANIVVVISGGLVLLFASVQFREAFLFGAGGIGIVVASIGVVAFWMMLGKRRFMVARVLAAGQVLMILVAAGMYRWPELINGQSLYDMAAPSATINVLGGALIAGLLLIGPAFVYLYLVFKRSRP